MPPAGQSPSPHRFFCPKLPKTDSTAAHADSPDAPGPPAVSDPRPPRCPQPPGSPVSLRFTLDRPQSHHARNVLRLSVGDAIECFDGQGNLAHATIQGYDSGHALCLAGAIQHHTPISPSITLASAVPKGPRADAMVAQLSQLGVDRFIPLRAEHSVSIPRPAKLDRFARSTIESAKQCRRLWLMRIDQPLTPHDACAEQGYDLKLIAAPGGHPLPDLADRLRVCRRVLVLVGPEGGWSPAELTASTDAGCLNWPIAPNVLRIETAATAAAAVLRYLRLPPTTP